MKESQYYGLQLPEAEDFIRIETLTDNFKTIDTQLMVGQTKASAHEAKADNPHRVTKAQVGLGNAPNESKATLFANPVFTGVVSLPAAAPENPAQAAHKQYVDTVAQSKAMEAAAKCLPLVGGTLTGALTLHANPAAPLQPVTRQYMEEKLVTTAERSLWNTVSSKVDKISGKELSSQDYTAPEKTKLAGIATGANNYTLPLVQTGGASTTAVMSQKAVTDAIGVAGGGDMLKSVYDKTGNGKVDVAKNAETVNNLTVLTAVPAGAKFTDTVFTHPNSGAAAGTYRSVAINAHGHVTAGTNPTTLAGYGITDAESAFAKNNAFNKNFGTAAGTVCQGNDARLTNARPANGGTSAACSGNAATATSARNDEDGRNISSTYATIIRAAGNSLELTSRYGGAISSVIAPYAASANYATNAYQANGGKLLVGNGKIQSPANQQLYLAASSGEPTNEIFLGVLESGWRFCPMGNSSVGLGTPSKRFRDLHLVNAPNVSSDRRLKQDITPLDSRYTQLLLRLPACRYRLIEDSASGYRCGFIAQDVEALLDELKLVPEEFTALVKSPVYKDVQVIEATQTQDPDGEIAETQTIADRQLEVAQQHTYSLRYEEFIAPLLALVQTQQTQITGMEAAQAAMQGTLEALSTRLTALEGG